MDGHTRRNCETVLLLSAQDLAELADEIEAGYSSHAADCLRGAVLQLQQARAALSGALPPTAPLGLEQAEVLALELELLATAALRAAKRLLAALEIDLARDCLEFKMRLDESAGVLRARASDMDAG